MDNFEKKEKEIIVKNVGKRIQECRLRAKLTQEQVAEKTGISQKHISRIEQGYHDTHFYMIFKIAKALDVPIDAFAVDFEDSNVNIFLSSIKKDIHGMSCKQLEMIKDSIAIVKKYEF